MKSIKCLDSYPENVQNVIRGSFVQALGDSFSKYFYFLHTFAEWTQ